MVFLDLALQGIRGFAPSARATFKSGYVVLKPGGSTLPPLGALFSALLWPDGRAEAALAVSAPGKPSKAGLTLLGNDQVTYRLIRELGKGIALQRLDKASSSFVPVADDAGEVNQVLQSE